MSLQLASPFQDHAVLQRDQLLPVWGWAPPGAEVRARLAGNEAIALANSQGEFLLRLPALPAGGPHELVVELAVGGERVVVRDLLVGEVWLASGQSNMEWTMASCLDYVEQDIASANFPEIRLFKVERRADLGGHRTVEGTWKSARPDTVPEFSAVAYSFARRLHRELGVPIGILSSSWGGTFIQAWMSRSTLALNPELGTWLRDYEAMAWTQERWDELGKAAGTGAPVHYPRDPGRSEASADWHAAPGVESQWETVELPTTWQALGRDYSGVFWFRRTVEIPGDWVGHELVLNLGAADKQDITYVNGVEVGRTGKDVEAQYWDRPRSYLVPAELVTGTTLSVVCRVYSFAWHGGLIGPAAAMRLECPALEAGPVPLAGTWRMREEHNLGQVNVNLPMGHGSQNSPHILFDNMIQPLVPYALRGAIWYQGESNAGSPHLYTRLMRDLILDWRRAWGQADLAFHLVQLPYFRQPEEYQPASTWALLREAQLGALALPGVGVAITIELGDAEDIHPRNKMPVGERLAQYALTETYGRDIPPSGPLPGTFVVENGNIHCELRHTGGGLTTTDGLPPQPFYLAGADRRFRRAEARIVGYSVVVSHPEIPQPVAVRYAWADNPQGCNLANLAGLPASPFRSDDW